MCIHLAPKIIPPLLALSLVSVTGCAKFPEVPQQRSLPAAQQVDFEGLRGRVSKATGDAILKSLGNDEQGSDILQRHLAYEQAVNHGGPLVLGNKVTLLRNGPSTYAAMLAAIKSARDTINLETYIFGDGEAGQQFSEVLLERSAAGVQVNVIHDSIGSLMTPTGFFQRLRDGGVQVLEFNPVNPTEGDQSGWLPNNRDHRRQLIVDGRIAFTGGVNISDTYSSAPLRGTPRAANDEENITSAGWRDTHIQIEGPVVAEFQLLFFETWTRQQGVDLARRDYFPEIAAQGKEIVRAIGSTPDDPQNLIYLTLISAIRNAELTAHLTIAYFAPNEALLDALTGAARRGVDVVLVLPSYSDSSPIFYLGRASYTELLESGVKIYERSGSVMHAKTACIDGIWSTIGSSNLDSRSFLHNDEIVAVILGREFAGQMGAMFIDDMAQSQEIELGEWRRRPFLDRIKEQLSRLGSYWL